MLFRSLTLIEDDGLLDYVSVDMGMLQDLHYYSGAIFKGFTYGIGFPLFAGGRYDRVAPAFGGDLTATGFSLGVNMVMTAQRRRGDRLPSMSADLLVGYARGARTAAGRMAADLREQGLRVELDCCNTDRARLPAEAALRKIQSVLYVNENGSAETLPVSPATGG